MVLPRGIIRLDLRGKAFRNILQTVSGGKKSLEFHTKAAAERSADEIAELLQRYGLQRVENLTAVMRSNPVDLQNRLAPFNASIQDAVDFFVKIKMEESARQRTQTFSVLIDEWLAEKKTHVEQKTMRSATYETLFYKAKGYKAQWGTRPIATINSGEIKLWVENLMVKVGKYGRKAASQVSKQHQISYLSQFFIWCKKHHGTPKDNPCETIEMMRNKTAGAVSYFTPEEARKIMDHATTQRFISLLPYHAICLFSGVRATECGRLIWDNIDFEDGSIVLSNVNSKTRGRRPAMQPNLIAWLKWFHEKYPQYPLIPKSGFGDRKRQFRKTVGLDYWHKNGMRHSAASYTLGAKLGDYGYLEQHFGNSRTMLQTHYLSYPSSKDSAMFWNILPPVKTV
jgi:integrase